MNKRKDYRFEWECRNPEKMIWHRAKYRALRKGIEFTIEVSYIEIPELCPALGIPLQVNKGGRSGHFPNSPSLDRHDPAKGYVPGNITVISARANLIKQDATAEEIRRVYEYAACCS